MMHNQHLIDSAIFDTTYAVDASAYDRSGEIEEYVKKELMKVVDEVFDKIDKKSSKSDFVFRINKIEIDLGEIPYREYRQQMPGKLREQLVLVLGEMHHAATRSAQTDLKLVDRKSAKQAQLFYFLRNGYLPWYSRPGDVDALESLLIDAVDSSPAELIKFMRENAQHAWVIERLHSQFSQPVVERVMHLLPSSKISAADRAADIDQMHAQLVRALLSGDVALLEPSWVALYDSHAELLEETLRYYGQQASVRQYIVTGFSATLFDDLLRLLEPDAHGQVKTVLDHAKKILGKNDQSATDRSQTGIELRKYSLAYLLVERGNRFDEKSYVASLHRQLAASSNQNLSTKLAGELSQRLQSAAHEDLAFAQAANLAESYSQYERVKATVTTVNANRRFRGPGLLADIRALAQDTPWLLMRLYRELQSGKQDWERAIAGLPVPVLAVLTQAFLSINNQSDVVETTGVTSELGAAIRSNVAKSKNRQFFYAQLLGRLIKGELIDFDAISAAEPGGSTASIDTDIASTTASGHTDEIADDASAGKTMPALSELAPRQMLLCAELLTTASYTSGISLSAAQLEKLKWRFIKTYLTDTANLYNERYFSRAYVETLIRQANLSDTLQFRASLSRSLLQNSLPSTRDLSRRLIDLLADESEDIPSPDARPVGNATEPEDASAPIEDIYIANAGAVLVAPYLPRLFERLGLTDAGKFNNRDAAERGVHCVQYLVNQSCSSPEYQLVLNKLLCGVRPGRPIRRSIAMTADEKTQCEALLHAITQHWKALGNTSIAGLRESFLQRNGRLQLIRDAWHLSVETRSFDMLLDQIPWSFSTIKFPWMDRVIYVEWR